MDGEELGPYDGVSYPLFSPDSQRLAFIAWIGDQSVMVVDDEVIDIFDHYGDPVFSPDSQHVAFVAYEGNKRFVVVDGEKSLAYDLVFYGNIIFDESVE